MDDERATLAPSEGGGGGVICSPTQPHPRARRRGHSEFAVQRAPTAAAARRPGSLYRRLLIAARARRRQLTAALGSAEGLAVSVLRVSLVSPGPSTAQKKSPDEKCIFSVVTPVS